MRKVRSVPNKREVQEEQEKETDNKQMGGTGEKRTCRHWLEESEGDPYRGLFSSPKPYSRQTQP